MASARGDTKPCTAEGCAGTMQYDRRGDGGARANGPQRPEGPANFALDDKGWVCNTEPAHFRKAE
jgi:hypothetical protein